MKNDRDTQNLDTLADEEGRLERSYPKTALVVPRRVYLHAEDEQMLRWSGTDGFDYREPSFATLREFLALRDARPRAVLTYARRWGVLGLCRHNLPLSHNPVEPGPGNLWCDPLRDQVSADEQGGWELVSVWRRFAREAHSILLVAIATREGAKVSHEDAELAGLGVLDPKREGREEWPADLRWVEAGVNRWLTWGNVRPSLFWVVRRGGDEALEIRYGCSASHLGGVEFRLFGALAIQLMQAVSSDTLPAHCLGCEQVFQRTRSNCRRPCKAA